MDDNRRNQITSLMLLMKDYNDRFMRNLLELQKLEEESTKLLLVLAEEDPIGIPFKREHPDGKFWERDVPQNSDDFFKDNFRMEREHFDEIVERFRSVGIKQESPNAIALEKRIAIALYALGSSKDYRKVGRLFGIPSSMVPKILTEFCRFICRVFSTEYLPPEFLTQEKLEECVSGFEELGFPQCFGVLDGTHIEVRPPISDAEDYYNIKGWYSTILIALVDHRGRFLYVNTGCQGRCSKSQIYEASTLKKMVNSSDILKANSKTIEEVDVPVLLVGDSAFRFSTAVMKAYPFENNGQENEIIFNDAHSKTKRLAENAFRQLKCRFSRIHRGLDNRNRKATGIIIACCILHNFLNCKNSDLMDNWKIDDSERAQPEESDSFTDFLAAPVTMRNAISYFINKQPDR
ncbi:protein ANTAGONIST OF LIKE HETEROCHROMATIN PROTEIN 1-like [Drosophila elegans]|uniref:protein ANTAGONIST OF LIKE HETEROCHROMATIN PROTEIN 1-like n=1 Tax=Drosophila elegans TaxID=30023 RepID=UPI0007E779F3|nr:protein ANTAGONIST OF LIKE HETEROCHROMATIN PROTEIN 1-like [Drosophila elegans]